MKKIALTLSIVSGLMFTTSNYSLFTPKGIKLAQIGGELLKYELEKKGLEAGLKGAKIAIGFLRSELANAKTDDAKNKLQEQLKAAQDKLKEMQDKIAALDKKITELKNQGAKTIDLPMEPGPVVTK